jgi:hypothetical protein
MPETLVRFVSIVIVALAAAACGGSSTGPVAGPVVSHGDPSAGAQHRAADEPGANDHAASEAPTTAAAEAPPPGPVTCNREGFGPAQLSPQDYATRHGADMTDLTALATSKEQPVEVCSVAGQHEYLLQATCADGSRPLADASAARRARVGSVGPGGRCGAIIDLYQIPCPEQTYEVYMDLYFCLAGDSL